MRDIQEEVKIEGKLEASIENAKNNVQNWEDIFRRDCNSLRSLNRKGQRTRSQQVSLIATTTATAIGSRNEVNP